MRLEIFILGITAFFVYNAYVDGKYTKMMISFKKYYKMIFYALVGIGIYYILKRHPEKGREMLFYANNYIRYLPIDKTSMDMLSPIVDFTGTPTSGASFMESFNGIPSQNHPTSFQKGSGGVGFGKATKRAVSETKKKYVAASQDWRCGDCQQQLDHTFEIDHKIRLEYGGGNDVQNLVALCRNCHGRKTASENM